MMCPVTTRFRNPWIDPRVLDVRPAAFEEYLRARGWQPADSGGSHWKRFLSPATGEREAVLLPDTTDDDALANLLVECVGKVAAWEGRFAGELLDELLSAPAGIHSNGRPHPAAGR